MRLWMHGISKILFQERLVLGRGSWWMISILKLHMNDGLISLQKGKR